jgi:hypothetical protein
MRNLTLAGLLVASLSVSLAGAARADIGPGPSPTPPAPVGPCGASDTAAASPCAGKKAGDACTLASGGGGQCQTLRCTNEAGTSLLGCVGTSPAATDGGASGPVSSSSNCAIHAPGAAEGGAGLTLLGLAAALSVAAVRRRRQ